jgi:hypothetical protein
MCRALESELVQFLGPTIQVFTRTKKQASARTDQTGYYRHPTAGCVCERHRQKRRANQVHLLGGGTPCKGRLAVEVGRIQPAHRCRMHLDAEVDDQNLGQSLIDTVVKTPLTAHSGDNNNPNRRRPPCWQQMTRP